MKIKNLPQDDRPIEKSIYSGTSSLSNSELIAILLGSGTRGKSAIGLAEEILSVNNGGIANLSDCTIAELTSVSGVGETKASRLLAAVELGKRISSAKVNRRSVSTVSDVAALFMEDLRYKKKEYFKVALLNVKLEIISIETISIGPLSNAPVHPREVFNPAVKNSAAGVILVHNHPSGDPKPSEQDVEVTQRIYECAKLLGIDLIDHLIIGDGRFSSFKDLGLLP